MTSIKHRRQKAIITGETIALIGVLAPRLLMREERLREAVLGKEEKKDPMREQLPRAINS